MNNILMVNSKLRQSFLMARNQGNIDLIFRPFIESSFYLVTKGVEPSGAPLYFLQKSPNSHEFCVTVSENKEVFNSIHDIVLLKIDGKELLQVLDLAIGVVVAYEKGGDYLSPEQLDWFRLSLSLNP